MPAISTTQQMHSPYPLVQLIQHPAQPVFNLAALLVQPIKLHSQKIDGRADHPEYAEQQKRQAI
jgi:hypothetical protein